MELNLLCDPLTCSGHDDGAENWAILASLIETAKLSNIDPQAWFADCLTRLVNLCPTIASTSSCHGPGPLRASNNSLLLESLARFTPVLINQAAPEGCQNNAYRCTSSHQVYRRAENVLCFGSLRFLKLGLGFGPLRVDDEGYFGLVGRQLASEIQSLRNQISCDEVDTSSVAAGMRQACDKPGLDRSI